MSDNKGDEGATSSTPPPPPSPPESPSSKVSPFVMKLRSAPPGYFFQPERPPPHRDSFAAPTGPYFFYDTLSDPGMLRDVLGLGTEPQLRPATIIGYECKLWGQYPALLDAPEKIVHGAVYNVETEEHRERLASYETDNYRVHPCRIKYTDGNEPMEGFGYVFKFAGNVRDLNDGTFNLGTWLRRVKRVPEDSSNLK
ncbi:AIG2-like family [Aspergillus sclerotialis]|uniref:Putative gamma-glutamylcyclotransferase n=1 Tax=Aspergillus sclerotialis TaxID=2070753 RepID=A0A3A3A3S0_9EURO|nr:AIG2-like family [Aspergillus sclerotialis]